MDNLPLKMICVGTPIISMDGILSTSRKKVKPFEGGIPWKPTSFRRGSRHEIVLKWPPLPNANVTRKERRADDQ